jgi:hypothetical protein
LTTRRLFRLAPPGVALLVAMLLVGAHGLPPRAAAGETLGHPGYLVVEGAADTTAGFRWRAGPGRRERTLAWPEGVLTVPDSVACEPFGTEGLAVPVLPDLAGVGAGGALAFRSGRYHIDDPLHLTDGRIAAYLAAGDLEIRDERVRYIRPPASRSPDPRAGFLLLAGMILLVVVSLRFARRRVSGS